LVLSFIVVLLSLYFDTHALVSFKASIVLVVELKVHYGDDFSVKRELKLDDVQDEEL